MITELIEIKEITPAELFSGNGINNLITVVEEKVSELVPDLTTAKGRKKIASMARNVSRSKTLVDGIGKDMAKEIKDGRNKWVTAMDHIRDDTRKPLTDWEDAEQKRIQGHRDTIAHIASFQNVTANPGERVSAEGLRVQLANLESLTVDEAALEEFYDQAVLAKRNSVDILSDLIVAEDKYEADQAELQRLRDAETERQNQEDEQNPAEAVQESTNSTDIEDVVLTPPVIIDPPKVTLKQRPNIAFGQNDIDHKKAVNKNIHAAIMEISGLEEAAARDLVIAIINGRVPNVSINY